MSSLPVRDTLIQTLRAHSQRATTGIAYLQHLIGSRAGLNPTDVRAASILAQDGPMTAGGLQKRLHLTGGAATTAVDRLVRRGIATRSADPDDRRKVTVAINPDSLAAIQPVYDTIDRAFDEVLASYTDSELALLVRYFTDTITLTDKLIAQLNAQKVGEPEPTPGQATGSQGGPKLPGDPDDGSAR